MKGDFSRSTFKRSKHYSGVRMQQGRVQMDADWNEQADIFTHLSQTAARDIIGYSGAPEAHPGFGVTATADGSDVTIAAGRYYVDGMLCENEADVQYSGQPDYPNPTAIRDILSNARTATGLLYLDVWKRHVTALDDSSIREVALGGPDTSTRLKTVWQVRVLPVVNQSLAYQYGELEEEADELVGCGVADADWRLLTTEPTRALTARVQPVPPSTNACDILPRGGYQRLENQLYRVEVHAGGDLGTATFKWSRENGSVVTSWLGQDINNLRVASTGRDATLGFSADDWVELTDDTRELLGIPGQFVQIAKVQGDVLVIIQPSGTPVNLAQFPANPKIRRWDQPGAKGELSVAVPAGNDGFVPLEGGIEVKFSGAGFRTGDHWLIPARTVSAATQIGGIEWPSTLNGPMAQSPLGIRRSRSRLAIVTMDAARRIQVGTDCRHLFPALTTIPFAGGFRLQDIRFLNDYLLRNASLATITEMSQGFRVYCTAPLLVSSLQKTVVCTVTIYTPVLSYTPGTTATGAASVVGYTPMMIAATVDVVSGQPSVFQLTPSGTLNGWLTGTVANAPGNTVPARLTIKGTYILPASGRGGPLDANGDNYPGGDLDFFFTIVQNRPAYTAAPSRLINFQPEVLAGIGSHLV